MYAEVIRCTSASLEREQTQGRRLLKIKRGKCTLKKNDCWTVHFKLNTHLRSNASGVGGFSSLKSVIHIYQLIYIPLVDVKEL